MVQAHKTQIEMENKLADSVMQVEQKESEVSRATSKLKLLNDVLQILQDQRDRSQRVLDNLVGDIKATEAANDLQHLCIQLFNYATEMRNAAAVLHTAPRFTRQQIDELIDWLDDIGDLPAEHRSLAQLDEALAQQQVEIAAQKTLCQDLQYDYAISECEMITQLNAVEQCKTTLVDLKQRLMAQARVALADCAEKKRVLDEKEARLANIL